MLKRLRLAPVMIALGALVIILPLVMVGLRSLWNVGYNANTRTDTLYRPELVFDNAPEGTAYIDPLVKLDADDELYTEFTAPPLIADFTDDYDGWRWEPLGVNESSEITRLCEDGFVSLSLHYVSSAGVQSDRYENENNTYLEFDGRSDKENTDLIFDRYGGFRAAYVDENGNVLGITEPAVRVYDSIKPTALIADGNTLTFRAHGIPRWQSSILYSITVAEFVVIAALLVVALIAIMRKLCPN